MVWKSKFPFLDAISALQHERPVKQTIPPSISTCLPPNEQNLTGVKQVKTWCVTYFTFISYIVIGKRLGCCFLDTHITTPKSFLMPAYIQRFRARRDYWQAFHIVRHGIKEHIIDTVKPVRKGKKNKGSRWAAVIDTLGVLLTKSLVSQCDTLHGREWQIAMPWYLFWISVADAQCLSRWSIHYWAQVESVLRQSETHRGQEEL